MKQRALLFTISLLATGTLWGAAPGVSYTHYRFKVDAIHGTAAIGMQISELALLCDGENVTRKHLESVARAEPVPKSISGNGEGTWNSESPNVGEGVAKAIDGTTATKFYDCNASPVRSNAEYRDKCWVELTYTNAVRVTAYRWATADDNLSLNVNCRTPTAFRLQGSDDGETWTDIDVQTNFAPPTTAFTWTKPFPVGGATDMGGYATDAKWFRWTVRRKFHNNNLNSTAPNPQNSMQIGSFELYDAAGNNLAYGLTPVAQDTDATALNPGEATVCEPAGSGHGNEGVETNGFHTLFDGNPDSKYMCSCVLDTVRRITVTMRLPDDAAPIIGYGMQAAYDSHRGAQVGRNPARWTVDASYDGKAWFTLDERKDIVPPVVSNGYFNAGLPYPFQGAAPCGNEFVVGAFDADATPGNPIPGTGKTVKKVGRGSFAYAGGVPTGVNVTDGALTLLPAFSKFRFKTDALPPAATSSFGVQLAELMLFDDGTNVTYAGITSTSKATGPTNPDTGAPFGGLPASYGVDGVWGKDKGYYDCNISPTRSYDPNFDLCYLQIDYSSPRRVSSYAWATGHDCHDVTVSNCRHPYDFRLQGSNDGETWTDLDVRTGFIAPNASNVMTRAFSCPAMPDVAQGTSAKYFRLTIKSKKDNTNAHSSNGVQLSEFGLFDESGNCVNTNLTVLAKGKAVTALSAGEATVSAPKNVNLNTAEGLDKLFDGNCSTKFYYNNTGNLFDNSANWLIITMRLRDDAPDVYGYGLATANDNAWRDPDAWLLEASSDGTTWTTLDEKSGYMMTDTRRVWDMYAMPFPEHVRNVDWCVSNVCVAAGATLNVGDERVQIGGLTVDCATGGGTISCLNASEAGTLNLVNAAGVSFAQYELPLTVGTLANGNNLQRWRVTVNGVLRKEIRARPAEGGGIVLMEAGTTLIFR